MLILLKNLCLYDMAAEDHAGRPSTFCCPHCGEQLDATDIEYDPGEEQTIPGEVLVNYSTTCPACERGCSGAGYLTVNLQ